jgi:hypothetical protein
MIVDYCGLCLGLISNTFCTYACAICSGGCNVVCGELKSYQSNRDPRSCDATCLGTHARTRAHNPSVALQFWNPNVPHPFLVRLVRTIKSTLQSFFVPSYRVPLSSPQIVCLSIYPIMASFYPSDTIRSRLEWNATLNPAAAPQTTEESKYQRKVRVALHLSYASPYLVIRRRSSRPSVSLGAHGPCRTWSLSYG